MTLPPIPYDTDKAWASARSAESYRFTLSPHLWSSYTLTLPLNWSRVKFESTALPQVPNDLMGVYSFVVEPNVAALNLGYLVYVGMTRQNFRDRFRKYLRHQVEDRTNRPRVQDMLRTWPNHLSFYYAPIDDRDVVKSVEDDLMVALKPPVPRLYPAHIRERFKLLDIMLQ